MDISELILEERIMQEIEDDPFGILRDMFDFFNSEEKPLRGIEFLEFYNSLSDKERSEFIKETTKPLEAPRGLWAFVQEG